MEALSASSSDTRSGRAAVFIVALVLLWGAFLVLHRLVFSPLAGFPGPKIAAITGLYEFYYDFWKNGTYVFEIGKMHEKHGK